ncbi:MAG: apolipoprotein N-acyltransferase [Victivallales bacterium]|nr:apolipoprotein N-acyltransferase [Victivallales bacterium]
MKSIWPSSNMDSPAPQQNLAGLARRAFLWRAAAALLSGLLLSSAFPPLEWTWATWTGLLPLLLMPMPRSWKERLAVGLLFGYAHWATALHWLNEVGFGAGWLLGFVCALFPMTWYALLSCWLWRREDSHATRFPGSGILFLQKEAPLAYFCLFAVLLWIGLEWLRSWIFTGFPWDQLGVSQYRNLRVIQIAEWTGVYGVSFFLVLFNGILACEVSRQIRQLVARHPRGIPWHLTLLALVLIPIGATGFRKEPAAPDGTPAIRIAAIQGNLPQSRFWTEEQYRESLRVYDTLSREAAAKTESLSLILWPESAIPAPIDAPDYRAMFKKLQADLKLPFLIGAIQYRLPPGATKPEDANCFNSVFLFQADGSFSDYYDKIHCVPFGEYTPFGDIFPWLRDFIGMGRDLTPGRDYRVLSLPKGARAGVNICFEDAFPEASREFTRGGANLLMTVTNDSWYNFSSGAAQHASHVVFRAIENRRPFLRSGMNSHTELVTPSGRILGQLVDSKTSSPFTRDFQAYDIPVYNGWPDTFYTRYGNLFAILCTALAIAELLHLASGAIRQKARTLRAVTAHKDLKKRK